MVRRAFSLIELLVVIAIVAVLVAVLLPTLGSARESGRATACLSNLRSIFTIVRAYADEHKGVGPALGQPYTAVPNWAFVVQVHAGAPGTGPGEVFVTRSALVCPTVARFYGREMTRTYATNVTGQAGLPADPPSRPAPDRGNYDDPARPAHVRVDLIQFPARTPAYFDSAASPPGPGQPPATRTASVVDFRQPAHVSERLGRFHASRRGLNAGFYDGSARVVIVSDPWPPADWLAPLP
ncbi:MAG: prepilin-type N-terminal cleavage/methylation domain-containing protein [Phycisphaerae bacterium]|nr:prepilin-type N-terminal cleavage/methylation domain-containing protein [Phycisphaerae bacterium]